MQGLRPAVRIRQRPRHAPESHAPGRAGLPRAGGNAAAPDMADHSDLEVPVREGEMSDLKPCPFCGSHAVFSERSNAYGSGASGMEAPDIYVTCSNSKCPVKPQTPGAEAERYERGKGYINQRVQVEEDQTTRWNTRSEN